MGLLDQLGSLLYGAAGKANAFIDDPVGQTQGLLQDRLQRLANGAQSGLDAYQMMGSKDPAIAKAGFDRALGNMMGVGGLLTVKPVGGTWYKGMSPHDWTKPENPLIDPSQINRSSPFPTFGGETPELNGIRGFFAADPAVASRFAHPNATNNGAVFPVKLAADDARTLTIDAGGKNAGDIQFGKGGKEFQDAVRSGKYDAIVIKNTKDEGDIAVALTGSSIKSALAK